MIASAQRRRVAGHRIRPRVPRKLTATPVQPVPFLSGLVLPCVLAALLTWVFVATGAELALQRGLYRAGEGWVFADHPLVLALYRWGPKPALLAGGVALSFLLAATFRRAWRGHWRAALFLPLVLLLGSGLLVSSGFKAHWGRPRPRDVAEFGGSVDYRAPWQPATPLNDNGSFPSGHASMGFVLGAPALLYRRRRPALAAWLLAVGLIAGFAVGAARVVQGGHFPTDVLWAGVMVYVAAWTIHRVLFPCAAPAHAATGAGALSSPPASPTRDVPPSLARVQTDATEQTRCVVTSCFNEQDNVVPVLAETRAACPHDEMIAIGEPRAGKNDAARPS